LANVDSSPVLSPGETRVQSSLPLATNRGGSTSPSSEILNLAVVERRSENSNTVERGVIVSGKFTPVQIPEDIRSGEKIQVLVERNSKGEVQLQFIGRSQNTSSPSEDSATSQTALQQLLKKISFDIAPLRKVEELVIKQLRAETPRHLLKEPDPKDSTSHIDLGKLIPNEKALTSPTALKRLLDALGTTKDLTASSHQLFREALEKKAALDLSTKLPRHADSIRTMARAVNEYLHSFGENAIAIQNKNARPSEASSAVQATLQRITELATKATDIGENLLARTVRSQIEKIKTTERKVLELIFGTKEQSPLSSLIEVLKTLENPSLPNSSSRPPVGESLSNFARTLTREIESALKSEAPSKNLKHALEDALKTLQALYPSSRDTSHEVNSDTFNALSRADIVAVRLLNSQLQGILSLPKEAFDKIVSSAVDGNLNAQKELKELLRPLLTTLDELLKRLSTSSDITTKDLITFFENYRTELFHASSGDPLATKDISKTLGQMHEGLKNMLVQATSNDEVIRQGNVSAFDQKVAKVLEALTERSVQSLNNDGHSSILPALREALALLDTSNDYPPKLKAAIDSLSTEIATKLLTNGRAPLAQELLDSFHKEVLRIVTPLAIQSEEPRVALKIIDEIIRAAKATPSALDGSMELPASAEVRLTSLPKASGSLQQIASTLKHILLTIPEFAPAAEQELAAKAKDILRTIESESHSPSPATRTTLRRDMESLLPLATNSAAQEETTSLSLQTLRSIDSLLSTDRALAQIAPLMRQLGGPISILFPAILQGLLSKIEITVPPPNQGLEADSENSQSPTVLIPFSRVLISIPLPNLGRVDVDIAHRPGELLANILCERELTTRYLEKRIGNLSTSLQGLGFSSTTLRCATKR